MTSMTLWGVRLSPFMLKLEACLRYKALAYRRLPAEGHVIENLRFMLALEQAKRNKTITRYPQLDLALDEYPSVPFIRLNDQSFQYDSSAIAHALDQQQAQPRLFPGGSSLVNFVAHLIDEAFDEYGLYMVHHMRWVGSAKTTPMGRLLADEFKTALPPGGAFLLARSFPKRQVRRCPYLFSVAPKGYRAGVSRALTPPSREGFPETHSLLKQSWKAYLSALEQLLSEQAYLLGDCFTIADASAYGQLAMNLVDPEAAEKLASLAPLTHAWLKRIEQGEHVHPSKPGAELYLSPKLSPLLNVIMGTFSALMVQNEQAYLTEQQGGGTLFNEAAFNRNQALYHGKLQGFPFRSVVKTFQVRVWREIKNHWANLSETQQAEFKALSELGELFNQN